RHAEAVVREVEVLVLRCAGRGAVGARRLSVPGCLSVPGGLRVLRLGVARSRLGLGVARRVRVSVTGLWPAVAGTGLSRAGLRLRVLRVGGLGLAGLLVA